MTCPPIPRLAALLREGPGDEELEAHLGSCRNCQEALERLAGGLDWEHWLRLERLPKAEDPPPEVLSRIKEQLDRQTPPLPPIPGIDMLDKIGEGGSAVVYLGRQRGLDRLVAVKILRGSVSPEQFERAQRGIEAVARVQHPHVVQVYAVGKYEDFLYGVQEYVAGGSLSQALQAGPWPLERAALLVQALAEALQSVHDVGVVHRDIKPGNVLLTTDGSPKLADFGLAKPLHSRGLTMLGQVLGTPAYMSPEQARGEEATPASDIYSLGAVFFELLAGHPPFRGESPPEILQNVLHEPPPLPSVANPAVPSKLEAICLRCLNKEPHKRYPSARALADDLQRWRASVTGARSALGWPALRDWAYRQPGRILLIGLSLILAVTFVAAVIWNWHKSRLHSDQTARNLHETQMLLDQEDRELFDTRMLLARKYLEDNQKNSARMVLQPYVPAPGESARSVEWEELWKRCSEP